MSKFYTFDQNNTRGTFVYNKESGISAYVIIEASSFSEAIRIAKVKGLYFNGCRSGIDCECCGDRWNIPFDENGFDKPTIYDIVVEHGSKNPSKYKTIGINGYEVFIHYLNGDVVGEWNMKKKRTYYYGPGCFVLL